MHENLDFLIHKISEDGIHQTQVLGHSTIGFYIYSKTKTLKSGKTQSDLIIIEPMSVSWIEIKLERMIKIKGTFGKIIKPPVHLLETRVISKMYILILQQKISRNMLSDMENVEQIFVNVAINRTYFWMKLL